MLEAKIFKKCKIRKIVYTSKSKSFSVKRCAVIAFLLNDGDEAVIENFLNALRVMQLSVSLGGIQTCIEHAQTMSHSMLKNYYVARICLTQIVA